jgi:tetratricopeptide (TPR) repeat protein
MNRHNGNASAKEKKLIEVMVSRYSAEAASNSGTGSNAGATGSRSPEANPSLANIGGASNLTYARGLKALVTQYPGDPDITALYIDAVMLMHAWDFWNNDGSAKEWTPELVDLCAAILKKIPGHPGGLHYYIHLTEASQHPEAAFPNAEALKRLFPGIAHMVHMSSHEYERTGLYAQGVEVNDKADDALGLYDAMASNLALNRHSAHYYAVETYCAFSGAMYGKGMEAAQHGRNMAAPAPGVIKDQYQYMLPAFTRVRLGKWKELLLDSIAPDARWPYAGVLYHFARGLAFVYTGHPDSAARQLSQLRDQAKDPSLAIRDIPFNTPLQGAGIAEGILNGAILFSQKQYDSALSSLRQAIVLEDGLIYSEPRDWPIPARQFLGAYLLKLGKPAPAEKVYRQDLVWHPGNGWSLLGLSQSLQAQHKDAGTYRADALRSFSQAEHLPVSSVFLE